MKYKLIGLLLAVLSTNAISSIIKINFDNGWQAAVDDEVFTTTTNRRTVKTLFTDMEIANPDNVFTGDPTYKYRNHLKVRDGKHANRLIFRNLAKNDVDQYAYNLLREMGNSHHVNMDITYPLALSDILDDWVGRNFVYVSRTFDSLTQFGFTTLTGWNTVNNTPPVAPVSTGPIMPLFSLGLLGLLVGKRKNKISVK